MNVCDLCIYNPPSSCDGKPCTMCPATTNMALEQEPKEITLEDVKGYCKPRCLAIITNELFYELTHPNIKALKTGRWRAIYQGDEIINYRCSECEFGNTFGKSTYRMNYCPNCGAKMNGESE